MTATSGNALLSQQNSFATSVAVGLTLLDHSVKTSNSTNGAVILRATASASHVDVKIHIDITAVRLVCELIVRVQI